MREFGQDISSGFDRRAVPAQLACLCLLSLEDGDNAEMPCDVNPFDDGDTVSDSA